MPKDIPDRGHRAIMRIMERLGLTRARGLLEAEQEMCRRGLKNNDAEKGARKNERTGK